MKGNASQKACFVKQHILPNDASHNLVAFSSMPWNIGFSWPGDELMTRNTSAVAFSRSSASSRSRVRRASFVSSRADELR
jgi:hypothetical protein